MNKNQLLAAYNLSDITIRWLYEEMKKYNNIKYTDYFDEPLLFKSRLFIGFVFILKLRKNETD